MNTILRIFPAILITFMLFTGCTDDKAFLTEPSGSVEGNYDGRVIGTIHGIITTQDTSTPIDSVRVLYSIEGANLDILSDVNGYYRIDNLRERSYTLTFLSPDDNYADWMTVTNIAFDSAYANPTNRDYNVLISQNVTLLRNNAGVSGYVFAQMDPENAVPAVNAEVKITGLGGVLNADFTAYTNNDGLYSFTKLPAVNQAVVIAMPWSDDTIDYGLGTVNVNLVPGAIVNAQAIIVNPVAAGCIMVANNFANNDFGVTETIQIVFNKPVVENSLDISLFRGGTDIPFEAELVNDGLILTVDPLLILRAGTTYSIQVQGRSVDYANFNFGPLQFTTEDGIELEYTSLDVADGVVRNDVGLNEDIILNFSKAIDVNDNRNRISVHRRADQFNILIDFAFSASNKVVTISPVGSFRANTDYTVSYLFHSELPEDFVAGNVNFTTIDIGDAPEQVSGLSLTEDYVIDWNTRQIQIEFNSQSNADEYEVYGYDNFSVSHHIYLGRIAANTLFGKQQGFIMLGNEFDWMEGDNMQTPFANGIEVSILVRAVNDYGDGQFSDVLVLKDDTVPTFQLNQIGTAFNTGNDTTSEFTVRFDADIEYCNTADNPQWGFVEDGGDANYVLPENSAVWQWDNDGRNGTLTVTVPADKNGAIDQLFLLYVKDSSGNTQTDTVWVNLR